MLELNTMY